MKLILKLLSVFFIWGSLTLPAFALDPVYSDFFGKAIRGYDPVAYFTQSKPVKGDSDFTYRWNDAKWYFSSAENRDAFVKNPEKFAPQYGGYCAWAVSKGYTAKIDPNAWNIHDGKLYLNYSKSVQASWQQDIPGNIASGDKNWPKLLAE
ncbi:YHS domain-containing (seleno)protein [Vibrio owensii]|uniref:YHS domain-containing (seleno)protein n=1 Tax=Vibrio owensii TaxID=696485 RepID=UPI00215C373F|nr:YHS domain-containing (seleno)protein [Vibrio owensii]MCR9940406.1 YHS domain-containing protein [Vibrio owensii]